MTLIAQVKNAAQMMVHVQVEREGIRVQFADGRKGLMPYADLDGLSMGRIIEVALPNPYELHIRTRDGATQEYPWDFARAYCDPAYDVQIQRFARESRETLGRRLAALREQAGLTQQRLAVKAGVERSTIIRIEKGEHSPRLETLERLARGLGRRVEELLVG